VVVAHGSVLGRGLVQRERRFDLPAGLLLPDELLGRRGRGRSFEEEYEAARDRGPSPSASLMQRILPERAATEKYTPS
jgi:hypothetical protein